VRALTRGAEADKKCRIGNAIGTRRRGLAAARALPIDRSDKSESKVDAFIHERSRSSSSRAHERASFRRSEQIRIRARLYVTPAVMVLPFRTVLTVLSGDPIVSHLRQKHVAYTSA